MTEKPYRLIDIPEALGNSPWKKIYRIIQYPFELILGLRTINWGYDVVSGNAKGDTRKFLEEWKKIMDLKFGFPPDEEIEKLRSIKGPLAFVANHPYGGIEALPFIELMFRVRPEFKVIVNFLLFRFRELQPVFMAVDPYETPEAMKRNLSVIKKIINYLKAGNMVGVFPAGEVSSYKFKEKAIRDREWGEAIFRIFQKTDATIVPVLFLGRNSLLFQIVGFMHPFIRTAFLPGELIRSRRRKIRYIVGDPITPDRISHIEDPAELAAYVREKTYELVTRTDQIVQPS